MWKLSLFKDCPDWDIMFNTRNKSGIPRTHVLFSIRSEKWNFRSLTGIEPAALRFRCSALTDCIFHMKASSYLTGTNIFLFYIYSIERRIVGKYKLTKNSINIKRPTVNRMPFDSIFIIFINLFVEQGGGVQFSYWVRTISRWLEKKRSRS